MMVTMSKVLREATEYTRIQPWRPLACLDCRMLNSSCVQDEVYLMSISVRRRQIGTELKGALRES